MKRSYPLLLLLVLTVSVFSLTPAWSQEDDVKFDFNPGKFRTKKPGGKFETTLFWGFGPTIVNSNTTVDGTFYPEFKPFSSWSNDLGILGRITLGGQESKFHLNTGLLWRYVNVETEDAGLGLDGDNPIYAAVPEAENTELNVHYLSLPLLFEYRSKFSIALGGFAAYRLGSSSEVDSKVNGNRVETKIVADFGLNDLQYGLTAQIGGKRVRAYANYFLNNLFKNDEPYDFSVLNIGICFQ